MITTRDVTLNEKLFYNPNEPALASQLREEASHLLDKIEIPYPPIPTVSQGQIDIYSDTDNKLFDDLSDQQRS